MASESDRQSLPFEPKGAAKKSSKSAAKTAAAKTSKTAKRNSPKPTKSPTANQSPSIPKVVSQRMVKRMLFFSGLPTFLGMAIFIASYVLLTRHILEFPKTLVLLSTLGCFGLGVLGLTYGVLSASWEEDQPGKLLGVSEFSINFRRMVQALRQSKQKPS